MRLLSWNSPFLICLFLLAGCDEGSVAQGSEGGESGGTPGTTAASSTATGTGGGPVTASGGGTTAAYTGTAVTATGGQPTTTTTGGTTSTVSAGCTVTPANPKATQQAKNLLCYLYSVYKKNVLSGQQETSWNWGTPTPSVDVEWIKTQTGQYPAVLGGDYLYPGDTAKGAPGTTDRAKAWWNAGGIVMIRYHMGAPPLEDTYDNSKGSVSNLNNVVTAGTTENTSFKAKLDYVAKELTSLQNANVPVLWAPFHEVQPNGWFWWSKGTGAQYIAIWQYAYDYLTTAKGLNNLIWLLPFSGSPNAGYYPGKAYVDIAGPDTYEQTGMPFTSLYKSTVGAIGNDSATPIALHETGTVPQPSTMFPSTAPWVLFSIWASFESDTDYNSVANIKSAYSSTYTLTRDEVPSLK